MRLRGTDYGRVLCSSGALGFFGDGYWYHGAFRPLGLDYLGIPFVTKTTTLLPRAGNMPMGPDLVTPRDLLPGCVRIRPVRGAVLNSVGLSGPGAAHLIRSGRWQEVGRPFFISFMSVCPDPASRTKELREFLDLLEPELPRFRNVPGLEVNFSCPNVGVDHSEGLIDEAVQAMGEAARLSAGRAGVPLVPNFSPDVDPETVLTVARESSCDAVSVANTVRWGSLPDQIDWRGTWGSDESPLAGLGGGGVSGAPLTPVVLRWARRAAEMGLPKPLVMGGGILSSGDARSVLGAGASAVKLGVVGMLRPWRVRGIVRDVRSST